MTAQFEYFDGDDRRHLLDAADELIAALEHARHSSDLRRIRGDLAQLENDVKRMRRVVEHQPTLGVGSQGAFEFWS